ncbi:MAG: hypothetical protein ABEI74_02235 [Candidatus Pacearchaeota archaeon]
MENALQTNDGKYRISEKKLGELRKEITELSDQGKFPNLGEEIKELSEKDSIDDYESKGFEFKDISNQIPEEADYHI